MKILATSTFKRQSKKPHLKQKSVLDPEIERLKKEPLLGISKLGDLAGLRVHKFQMINQLMLLAYFYDPDVLTLVAFGTHENFYRDLKMTLDQ